MTLIVGIKCTDGVVLGADGAATYGSLGQPTIRQPVEHKLQIRKDCIVVGVSGPVGLGQRFAFEVEQLYEQKRLSGVAPERAMTIIAEAMRPHILAEIEVAKKVRELVGPAAIQSALTATLVAVPAMKQPCLFQFDQQGAPEMATADLPFVSIGIGQTIADPFLALLRRLLWPNRLPTLAEATFSVVWTLYHGIQTNAGGVAEPIQVAQLQLASGACRARELQGEELQEHRQFVASTETALTDFVMGKESGTAPAVPEPSR